jgi:hypothetical protein
MRQLIFLLLSVLIGVSAGEVRAQKQIVCGGRKMTIDEKTTFVRGPGTSGIGGSVLNGRAIFLPAPVRPKNAADYRFRGVVNVQVIIDEEGNVTSPSAVSGPAALRPAAVEAARRAKFKKLLSDCRPKKYTGTIFYNFAAENESEKSPNEVSEDGLKPGKSGDLTKKALYLPPPRVPLDVRFSPGAVVTVKVVIDAPGGKVIAARAVSGPAPLRSFAEDAARCARFDKTGGRQKVTGFLRYKFDESNKVGRMAANGGILNLKAISLPPPVWPPETDVSGTIAVRVELDEEGNVISAKAVSGRLCLGEAAVEAARQAKFTKTLLSGVPVRVSGIVVYNFPAKNR